MKYPPVIASLTLFFLFVQVPGQDLKVSDDGRHLIHEDKSTCFYQGTPLVIPHVSNFPGMAPQRNDIPHQYNN